MGSTASLAGSIVPQEERANAILSSLSDGDRENLTNFCSSISNASTTGSRSTAHAVRAISPLLLASDAGLSSFIVHSNTQCRNGVFPVGSSSGIRPRFPSERSPGEFVPKTFALATPTLNPNVDPEDFKCAICLELWESPVVTPCLHLYCGECLVKCLTRQVRNPN
eukprot:Selendium_serpulae@DN11815_c0_g1_i1.p1